MAKSGFNKEIDKMDIQIAEVGKYHSMQDITSTLAPIISKTYESHTITQYDAPLFLGKLREGLYLIAELKAQCSTFKSQAKKELERTEAVVRMEKFPAFAEERGIQKPTEKDKQAFLVMQEEYEQAYDEVTKWESICTYVDMVRSAVYTCIDDTKKNLYSQTHYNNRDIKG